MTPISRLTYGRKRAVAGIVAALILFVMLFTVGTGYFLWINTTNGTYSQALANKGYDIQNQQLENLQITTAKGGSGGNDIVFTAINLGGVPVIITSVFVNDNSPGTVSGSPPCTISGSPCTLVTISPALPLGISQGLKSTSIDTGVLIPSGYTGNPSYTVKIVTQRGNTFTQQYPMPVVPFAIVSGSTNNSPIGLISMDFNYFKVYSVTCSSGNPSNPPAGGCQVNGYDTASQFSGYGVSKASLGTGNFVLFALSLTNADPNLRDITLSPGVSGSANPSGTVDEQFSPPPKVGGGTTSAFSFILGGVCQVLTGCTGGYSYGHTLPPASLTLPRCSASGTPPNQVLTCTPLIVYFYSTVAVSNSLPFNNNQVPIVTSNLIYLSGSVTAGGGCVPVSPATTCSYGQSLPFATTLWTS